MVAITVRYYNRCALQHSKHDNRQQEKLLDTFEQINYDKVVLKLKLHRGV